MTDTALECRVLRTPPEWDAISTQWEELHAGLPEITAFQDFSFLRTWWRHFGQQRSLFIVVASRGARICGIAPLQRSVRRRGIFAFPTLEFLGMPDELDRPQLLVADGDSQTLQALLACLAGRRSEFAMLQLDELPASSWQLPAIESWAQDQGLWNRVEPLHPVPFLHKRGDWPCYLASRSKHFRKRLRASQRKAERLHALSYRIAQDSAEASELARTFFDVESRSWKREAGVDVGGQEEYRRFYDGLLGNEHGKLKGHAIVQYLDGEPSAATIGVSTADCYYSLQIAHDLRFNALSPGTLLEAFELEWFFAQSFGRYEFLGGAGFNKRRWTDQAVETCSVHIRRPGLLMAAADAYRFYGKPWLLERLGHSAERPQASRPFQYVNAVGGRISAALRQRP